MKPLVIYHADCTDGYGAAFAAWMKLGDEAEYLPVNYNQPTNQEMRFVKGRDVYILDFSYAKDQMEYCFANAKRVVWLDHHKTAFEMWCGKAPDIFFTKYEPTPGTRHGKENYIVLDNYKSGALLAWEYFHPGTEVPMLIRHIDDRDRWQFKLQGSKELHAALASYKPWSFEQWKVLYRETHVPNGGSTSYLTDFLNQGHAILRAQDQHVQSMAKQARKCRIPDFNVGEKIITAHMDEWELRYEQAHVEMAELHALPGLAVNASLHLSEVGHELANQSGTYGLVWYVASDGRVNASLRSNGDYDVSAIAKSFGGGGHRNAAGFQTDINTLMGWLK